MTVSRKDWVRALEKGSMDLPGAGELHALYLDLARSVRVPLLLERELPQLTGEEAQRRLSRGEPLADLTSLRPRPAELAARGAEVAEALARRSEDNRQNAARAWASVEGRNKLPDLARVYLDSGEAVLRETMAGCSLDGEVGYFIVFNSLKGAFLPLKEQIGGEDLSSWEHGNCPVCAGSPALGLMEGEGGKRSLVCHRCEFRWPYHRIRCPFCGNDDHRLLGYLAAGEIKEGEPVAFRLDTCDSCGTYLKTRDLRAGGTLFPEVEDLLTPALDLTGARQGYRRGGAGVFGVRPG
jgi:FdhE protein